MADAEDDNLTARTIILIVALGAIGGLIAGVLIQILFMGWMGGHGRMMHRDGSMMHGPMNKRSSAQSDRIINDTMLKDLEPEVQKWAKGIRGELDPHDARKEDRPVVAVGAGEQGITFEPAVLRIEAGTTVRFRWTGTGSAHNVAFIDRDVQSSLNHEAGRTFEVTFNTEGAARYHCTPHRGVGMKGLVVVE